MGTRQVTHTLLSLLFLVLAWPSKAMADVAVMRDSAYYAQFPYIRFIETDDSIAVSDEEFLDDAAKVIFTVNRYDLPENSALLRRWRDELIPQLNRDRLQLYRVLLRGAASPEGPFENNRKLGVNRAKALYDFFNEYLETPVSERQFVGHVEVEDYRSLCIMMKRAGDPAYPIVQELYDNYHRSDGYGELKDRLMRAEDGQLWQRLLRDYFPQLRAARMLLYFRRMPGADPIAIERPSHGLPDSLPLPDSLYLTVLPQLPATPSRLPRRELLSLKTNLLFYGVYMPGYNRWCPIPNVAVEYYPKGGHFTFGASVDFPWWVDYGRHKFFEIRNYQVEGRYYFGAHGVLGANGASGKPAFSGLYLMGYGHGGLFEIGFNENKGWRGHGFGAGVGAGYVVPVSRNGHWRLDFSLQVGWFTAKHDPFQYENPVNPSYHDDLYYYKWTGRAKDFKELQYRFNWLGPTRVGITLSYDLLYRRAGNGASGERRAAP